MKKNQTESIRAAAARALDTVALGESVGAQTVREAIEQALAAASNSGNAQMRALETANGGPLSSEDAVIFVLQLLALRSDAGQN